MDQSVMESGHFCDVGKTSCVRVCAECESPMILNVLWRMAVCGARTIRHPRVVAMSNSPLLKGFAMFQLLTLSSQISSSQISRVGR